MLLGGSCGWRRIGDEGVHVGAGDRVIVTPDTQEKSDQDIHPRSQIHLEPPLDLASHHF